MIINFKSKSFELVHNPIDTTFTTNYVLHGHIHKSGKRNFPFNHSRDRFYNCNIEYHKYKPKLLNEILGELQLKKP